MAADAILAARAPHAFMGMTKMGVAAIFETRGNDDCHVILRGGKTPNYDAAHVAAACDALRAAGLREQVMIDVSHGNSSKQHRRQIEVAHDVAAQIAAGERRITGVMIESHLEEGRQDLVPGVPLQARRVDHRRLHRLRADGAGAAGPGAGGARAAHAGMRQADCRCLRDARRALCAPDLRDTVQRAPVRPPSRGGDATRCTRSTCRPRSRI